MIPKEQITYYTSVTYLNGTWQAYCYLESCNPSVYDSETDCIKTFQCSSDESASTALWLMSYEIKKWESENIKS
jgi:hypothetical protein